MNEEQTYCAYEHCQRPIESQPGHRRKEYCNDSCRQAAHRLRKDREQREKKANLNYYLTKYHSAHLRAILERTLQEQGEVALLRLAVAIDEERSHVQASDEMQRRVAHLEIQLAEYRSLIDLQDRARIEQQFLAVGQLLNFRKLDKFRIGEGSGRWENYRSWTDELTLAEVILYGREILEEEAVARARAEEKSQLRQVERQLGEAQKRMEELECRVDHGSTLIDQQQVAAQLAKDLDAVRVGVASAELCQTLYGHALLVVKEREHEVQHLQTRISKQYERRIPKLVKRIEELEQLVTWERARREELERKGDDGDILAISVLEHKIKLLEAERAAWMAWKEAQIRGHDDLTAIRQYLQEHRATSLPIKRNGVTVKILALGQDAVAVTEDHGMIRLNDEELEQGRIWVVKKTGAPVVATRLPIGALHAEGQRRLDVEQELDAARAEIQTLHRELARYLPAPRALLECSLRLWSTRTKLFHDDVEGFIREASDRRLRKEIDRAQDCYFLGQHRQRRIGIIADAIQSGDELLYRGDLVITNIDVQGYVTFASGGRKWLDTDEITQFWALIVAESGQRHVGGNVAVAPIQQYLCEHPGESLPIQRGKEVYQIVLVDDDACVVTTRHRHFWLYDDGREQALAWIKSKRDAKHVSR
jgi:hypothetical protein